MKQFISILCAWVLVVLPLPFPAFGQQLNQNAGSLAATSTDCSTAGSCIMLTLNPLDATASIVLGGTFVGTEVFEASAGGLWSSISCPTWAGGAAVASVTATGAWTCDVAGKMQLRVRQSAYTSGTPIVSLTSSTARSSLGSIPVPQGLSSTSTPTFATANVTGDYTVNGVASTYRVATDFQTDGASVQLNPITGLSWTLPALTAMNVPFGCTVAYSQGTGGAAVSFGMSASAAPTNLQSEGIIQTNATVITLGQAVITTAASSATVTGTPAAQGTVFMALVNGFIENPSQSSVNTIALNVKTATAADGVTVKRGSFCKLF